jgi:predicted nucleic acid-binding protein
MPVYFLDSSALVKRYINETGSSWVVALFDPQLNNEVFIAAITGVEIIAAITRRSRGGSISFMDATAICQQLRSDLQNDYQTIEIVETVTTSAMTLAEAYGLRGYDAIQLAVGCAVNTLCVANGLSPIVFVSADHELNGAAVREGLAVEDPNSYI